MEEIFTCFGVPAKFHSDQGRNFESQANTNETGTTNFLQSNRTAVQKSSQCTTAALMFGRELRTLAEFVFGTLSQPEIVMEEMDYLWTMKDRLQEVHDYIHWTQIICGLRKKGIYDNQYQEHGYAHGLKFTSV
ncbi:hypothetical protein ATANTOWER_022550 [Ataeniobius toweri]|uniref:Integrase catalytic domain-containing protein n=1 Tax=Ataeniobius toweri TaxID=208326 RepID=A0ABU7AT02_9TELE|nr:hypothetical protein [Ataeniobius toweri]